MYLGPRYYVMDVVVSGNLAYYANWDLRLDVYDIASCDDVLVVADGFESGETGWWSSTVKANEAAP